MSNDITESAANETLKMGLTKEAFEVKIKDVVGRFNKNAEIIKSKTTAIDEVNKQIAELVDEQRRLQGEYRAIYNLGVDFGIIKDGEFTVPVN